MSMRTNFQGFPQVCDFGALDHGLPPDALNVFPEGGTNDVDSIFRGTEVDE